MILSVLSIAPPPLELGNGPDLCLFELHFVFLAIQVGQRPCPELVDIEAIRRLHELDLLQGQLLFVEDDTLAVQFLFPQPKTLKLCRHAIALESRSKHALIREVIVVRLGFLRIFSTIRLL